MKYSFVNILKIFITLNLVTFSVLQKTLKANQDETSLKKESFIGIEYLNPKNELSDYIVDSGDILWINFDNNKDFTGAYFVNNEGEIFIPRLNRTYVKDLSTKKIEILLNEAYSNYLLNPKINISVIGYRDIKVKIEGEVRSPGLYKFKFSNKSTNKDPLKLAESINETSPNLDINSNTQKGNLEIDILNNSRDSITTLSRVIRQAGGPTAYSDLSKIEIIREISKDQGGGKKRAIVNLLPLINDSNYENDIRIFDGDKIKISKSNIRNDLLLSKGILSGLAPKFIDAAVFGRVKNPGIIKLPLESTLSDAIDISGPKLPLSGKVVIMRYLQDGSLSKKYITFRSNSPRGSRNNPYLKTGDQISIRDSIIGKSTGILTELTMPFVGIYSTKELYENITE